MLLKFDKNCEQLLKPCQMIFDGFFFNAEVVLINFIAISVKYVFSVVCLGELSRKGLYKKRTSGLNRQPSTRALSLTCQSLKFEFKLSIIV